MLVSVGTAYVRNVTCASRIRAVISARKSCRVVISKIVPSVGALGGDRKTFLNGSHLLRCRRLSSAESSKIIPYDSHAPNRWQCSMSESVKNSEPADVPPSSVSDESGSDSIETGPVTNGSARDASWDADEGELEFEPLQGWGLFAARWNMLTAWPWQRVKKGAILYLKLGGNVTDQYGGSGSILSSSASAPLSLPQLCENLRKAAVDPRIAGLVIKVEPLNCGWAKVDEIKRHLELFNKSGKFSLAYMALLGEKEYYLSVSCKEIYVPPSAYVSIRGLAVQAQFLGGVLEKAGVQPEIERIGKFKSAGDQLSRKSISDENREMLSAILDDIHGKWVAGIAKARGKSVSELQSRIDSGLMKANDLFEFGLVDGLKYESEIEEMLKERVGVKKEKKLPLVDGRKYSKVPSSSLLLSSGRRGEKIAVIRAVGSISRGKGGGISGMMGGVRSDSVIEKIRQAKENKQIKAVVLRIDSPGGDALASDLMWQELAELSKEKPVIASMADVAASGGYYMAMGCQEIVAEQLTLTGSIGVVTGKFSLAELYERIGFNKEIISRGKFAELNADNRPFTDLEKTFFAKSARIAYESFRDKAALSRKMEIPEMEEFAQGRVWTGKAAKERGLVDRIGGIETALKLAKEKSGIPKEKRVRIVELSRPSFSLPAVLLSGASLSLSHLLSFAMGEEGGRQQQAVLLQFLLASEIMPAVLSCSNMTDAASSSFGSATSGGMANLLLSSSSSFLASPSSDLTGGPASVQLKMDEIVVDGASRL